MVGDWATAPRAGRSMVSRGWGDA